MRRTPDQLRLRDDVREAAGEPVGRTVFENVNDFIRANVGLVYRVLAGFRRSNPKLFNVIGDDLESAGMMVMAAVHKGYDPAKAMVSTYATTSIVNAMLKVIERHKRTRLNESTDIEWARVKFDARQIDLREALAEAKEREDEQKRIRRREQRMDAQDAARGQQRLFEDAA